MPSVAWFPEAEVVPGAGSTSAATGAGRKHSSAEQLDVKPPLSPLSGSPGSHGAPSEAAWGRGVP